MEIKKVLKQFNLDNDSAHLEVFIGKNLNRQLFAINNKIFFDVLLGYLQKNGWFVQHQSLTKSSFFPDGIIESSLQNKPSSLLNLSVPFTSTNKVYNTKGPQVKKYKGTYYDVMCCYCQREPVEEPAVETDRVYTEITQEVTVFSKKSFPFTIHFNVEKADGTAFYSVKVVFTEPVENDDQLNELFEIIDMAMAKYKKTDRTVDSRFEPI
jgi:hypothetical protein